MKMPLLKLFGIVWLALMFVNSGAAWALQRCLGDIEATEHAHIFANEMGNAPRNVAYPAVAAIEQRHQPLSRIHCPENHISRLSFGPASSVFRLDAPKEAQVKAIPPAALLTTSTSISNGNPVDWNVWLSPHLVLSKLRI